MAPTDMPSAEALAGLDDAGLPALATLLCAPEGLLGTALATGRGTLEAARPRQTTWVPGRSLTVRYDAQVRWEGAGRAVTESLVAVTGKVPEGALTLTGEGGAEVGVWRVPHDPSLPGLARLDHPAVLKGLLDDVGVPAGSATSRTIAYRPGRRAVVRVQRGGATVFLKVVRPHRAEALHRRHAALRTALPVPHSLGWSAELGIVVMEGLPGRVLRSELNAPARLPTGPQLLGLLDALPAPPDGAVSPGWGARHHVPLLARLRPDLEGALIAVAEGAAAAEAACDAPLAPIHGDFHEAQLLVHDGTVTGVLDVDTAALGQRVQDLATLIGHLSTLALGSPHRRAIERWAAGLLDVFDRHADPVALRWAVAAVVLGLATGPFRVLEEAWPAHTGARIALAERWAASAEKIAASSLVRRASRAPHGHHT